MKPLLFASLMQFPTTPPPQPVVMLDPIIHVEQTVRPTVTPIPEITLEPIQTLKPIEPPKPPEPAPVKARGYVPGNLYEPGNCTWYAKSKRPDLPNDLGNANTWFHRARAQGFSTGEVPRAGAIAVDTGGYYGHVMYVESVNPDGTINISDMNWRGLYQVTYRTIPSAYLYIY